MILWEDFEEAVISELRRDISEESNRTQNTAVRAGMDESLFLVAGPGSGKTTALALRVLKLIFIDQVDPSSIIATTFTRKAAAELRSRILGWGDQLLQTFLQDPNYEGDRHELDRIDINQIITGTLDSIAEEILSENRSPGTPPPAVIEEFVARALMLREGLFNHGRHRNDDLKDYVKGFSEFNRTPSTAELASFLLTLKDRIIHDLVDIEQYRATAVHPGASIAIDAVQDYISTIEDYLLMDFSLLERDLLHRLENNELTNVTDNIRFLLVDEYQDTNLLQENIYFNLTRRVIENGGSITIVGDDDQSLYRFRGATVNLFQSLQERISTSLGLDLPPLFLSNNYRSTDKIVELCNDYITLDEDFQDVRVSGKPQLNVSRMGDYENFPILGMFRNDIDELANDLANFIDIVVNGDGFTFVDNDGNEHHIVLDEQGGPSDIAMLSYSPGEITGSGRIRLPRLLRNNLEDENRVPVFNPRGRDLNSIESVSILCGLVLLCIDSTQAVQKSLNIGYIGGIFTQWRNQAESYINSNPDFANRPLRDFVSGWQNRQVDGTTDWPNEVSLMELIYKLITWIPEMQNDIEGVVYLEAISRTVTQTTVFSNYGGNIVRGRWEESSIREAYWNIFVPIASGIIDINEELLETLPPNYLSIMSIHQSKGLEFPFTIVDVGSDFKRNNWMQARNRYPRGGSNTCLMEDELRPCSPLGRPNRTARDRAFDDLYRLYFEAYSRGQDVLLLVGLRSVMWRVQHVATGWNRHDRMLWGRGLPNLVHI